MWTKEQILVFKVADAKRYALTSGFMKSFKALDEAEKVVGWDMAHRTEIKNKRKSNV